MAIAFLIGRIILGAYWLETAYNHIFKTAGLEGYAKMKGVKSAKPAIIATGLLALLGGLSVLLGVYPTYGIAMLVIFLFGVSYKMHAFWSVQDPAHKPMEKVQFKKNIALAGALLALLAVSQPWAYSF